MTISSLTNRKLQTANGVQDTFAYDFLILDEAHLVLYHDSDLDTPLTGFTVTGVGNQGGGTAIFTTPPAAGTIVLNREVPFTQTFDYITGGKFPADTHERLADLLVMMVQQLEDEMARSLQLPLDSTVIDVSLPLPEAQLLLQWNDTEDGLNNVNVSTLGDLVVTTPFTETFLDDPDAATARATLGVNSTSETDDAIAAKSTFVDNANGNPNISDTTFDVNAEVTLNTWESIGPTGSGADNIWTAMDAIPAGVDWVEVKIVHIGLTSASGADGLDISDVAIRKGGGAEVVAKDNYVSMLRAYTSAAANAGASAAPFVKVPVDSSLIFDINYSNTFENVGLDLYVIGYGYN